MIKVLLCLCDLVAELVFNVKGNDYRIVCAMDYPRHVMYIKFVGTHTEYDAVNVGEVWAGIYNTDLLPLKKAITIFVSSKIIRN